MELKANSLVGFHAGGFVSLFVWNNLAIQPEVLFSPEGALADNGIKKSDYNISYVNIPVMLKYRFNTYFYLEAGPQVGFKIHQK